MPYDGGKLMYAKRTRSGFTPSSRAQLFKRFTTMATQTCPFANLPEARGGRWGEGLTAEKMKECRWVVPTLVGQFEFVEWTLDGHLRHSRFVGMREDKVAGDVAGEKRVSNSKDITRKLFGVMSADLATVCPEITAEVVCPLCMRRFTIESVEDGRLSLEHVIPSALGGNVVTLTCTKCNNTDGSELDRNLVSAMQALDALEGRGTGLDAVWHNQAGHVAANVDWRIGTGETTNIKIVGKASNGAGVDAIRSEVCDGAEISLTFNLGFVTEKYWRAAFRCAYLAAFQRFGYAFAVSNNAQLVRRVIDATDEPPETILQAYPESEPQKQTFVVPIKGKWPGIVVILRLRSAVARYLAVVLPGREWTPLVEMAALHRELRLSASLSGIDYGFRFGEDPVKVLRKSGYPDTEESAQP